jgi:hypothetical protein
MTTEARMPEPSPIRGSFTIRWDPFGCDGRGGYRVSISNYEGGEVVPVPDEQAIERARLAINEHVSEAQLQRAASGHPDAEEEIVRVVLAAALEQPESPDLRPSTGSQETHAEVPKQP